MEWIRWMIGRPVTVTVIVLLIAIFGILSIVRFPIQLTPNVEEPIVTVTTSWPGASPQEVEREIIDRQEDVLKDVANLRKMTSESRENQGQVTLEFYVGTDRDIALRDVSDKLRQVEEYPEEANEPVVEASESAVEGAIAWFILFADDNRPMAGMQDFVEDFVKPRLERVEGVASINIFGGIEREVHVRVDPALLAAKGLTFMDLRRALTSENVNVSAGTVPEGKRDYAVRSVAQYEELDQVRDTVIGYTAGGPVYVRDVAMVEQGYEKQRTLVRSKGRSVIAMNAQKEIGANVITTMEGLQAAVQALNVDLLRERGLTMAQVYDETEYIHSSVDLVLNNLWLGILLVVIVLTLFLRSVTATLTVAVSIPISVVATFLVLKMMGRTLNVISLAGIAFASGMVVDNAIVVVENIYRHLQMGKTRVEAALDGAGEVWGAILASTLTTVAVFVPVVFVEEEAGQLFRDIALAISAAVALSLFVAMTVIPTLSARILRVGRLHMPEAEPWGWQRHGTVEPERGSKGWLHRIGAGLGAGMTRIVAWSLQSWPRRIAIVLVLTVGSLGLTWLLVPPSSYLPTGNRNLVFAILFTPPGYNIEEYTRIAETVEESLEPYYTAEPGSPEAAALSNPVGGPQPPPIDNFFFVAPGRGIAFMGVTAADPSRVAALADVVNAAIARIPDTFGFAQQASLFGRQGGGGNSVDLEIRGTDLAEVSRVGMTLFGASIGALKEAVGDPEAQVIPRPNPPNFMLARPEFRLVPNRVRMAESGYTAADIGFIAQASVDGADVGDFILRGDRIDLMLMTQGAEQRPVHTLDQIPVYVPMDRRVVSLGSLANFVQTDAPQQINHVERQRAVTVNLTPPQGMALETAVETLDGLVQGLRRQGVIPPTVDVVISGEADKLHQTRLALQGNFILAAVITYLLMAALFESFSYPLVIMFSVPLATVGGFAALGALHWWTTLDPYIPVQQMDVLTMLGFVILIGIVVNNAILIVHQALNFMHYGMGPHEAIVESVRTRIRPIYMTAMTTVFGMAPLVIMPGEGSELYRGLGAVVLGGLLGSTIFTVFLVPVVFAMFLDVKALAAAGWRKATGAVPAVRPARRPAPASVRPSGGDGVSAGESPEPARSRE